MLMNHSSTRRKTSSRLAAPAVRVAVGVLLDAKSRPFFSRSATIGVGDLGDVLAGQPAEAVDEDAVLVERRDHGQAVLLAKLEVFLAAARRDVDDAGAFGLADLVPRR